MSKKDILPVLRASHDDIAPLALVVGDPKRAYEAAMMLDNMSEVGRFREYVTYTGNYNGTQITISSHGVGGGGASVCFEELIMGGVKVVVRAGTCGGMGKGIEDGEFVIGTGAIREDGISDQLLPIQYPAIADWNIVNALRELSITNGIALPIEGIILTQGPFYPGITPSTINQWLNPILNVVGVEMEFATLLTIAAIRGIRAGGLFVSDGNVEDHIDTINNNEYNPHRDVVTSGVETMLRVALDALVSLSKIA
jgi:uridine phosphorylase